jgi:HSP20 family protein
MTNTAITLHRPGLLGRTVFDDVFNNFFNDFPNLLQQTTQGYPVTDIYQNEKGDTVMEFALAGFKKEDLSIEVLPEKKAITVSARHSVPAEAPTGKRIARRSFEKTYVNFDNNLDLSSISAEFENGLLCIVVSKRPEVEPISVKIS